MLQSVLVKPKLFTYERVFIEAETDKYQINTRFVSKTETTEAHFIQVYRAANQEGLAISFFKVSPEGDAIIIKMVERVTTCDCGKEINNDQSITTASEHPQQTNP